MENLTTLQEDEEMTKRVKAKSLLENTNLQRLQLLWAPHISPKSKENPQNDSDLLQSKAFRSYSIIPKAFNAPNDQQPRSAIYDGVYSKAR